MLGKRSRQRCLFEADNQLMLHHWRVPCDCEFLTLSMGYSMHENNLNSEAAHSQQWGGGKRTLMCAIQSIDLPLTDGELVSTSVKPAGVSKVISDFLATEMDARPGHT